MPLMRIRPNFQLRLGTIALFALILSCPYAIPVFWLSLSQSLKIVPQENPGFLPSPLANQTWYIVFGGGAVLIATTLLTIRRGLPKLDPYVSLSVLIWFAITGFRAVFTPGIQWSYSDCLVQAAFLLLFCASIFVSASSRDFVRFQILATVITIPLALVALAQNAGFDPFPYSDTMPGSVDIVHGKHLVASTFGHPNYMGSYLAPLIIMMFPLFTGRSVGIRILAGAAVILSLWALIVGGTRGPLLALSIGAVVYFLFLPRMSLPWKKILILTSCALGAIIIAAILVPSLRPGFEISERFLGSKEIASRAFYWRVGYYAFAENPIFGVGPGQFDRMFWQNILKTPGTGPGEQWHFVLSNIIRGVRPGQMHNDHLQVLVETGLLGAIAWAAFWSAVARRGVRIKSAVTTTNDGTLNAALIGSFTVIFVDALFGFPLRLPCSGALFWFLMGQYATWAPEVRELANRLESSSDSSRAAQVDL